MVVELEDIIPIKINKSMVHSCESRAEKQKSWKFGDNINRNEEARFLSFYEGNLAEEAFKVYLDSKEVGYTHYDDIRTDDYKYADPYDFMVDGHEVSIKSLHIQKVRINRAIDEFYLHSNSPKEFNVQIYLTHSLSVAYIVAWTTKNDLEQAPLIRFNNNFVKMAKAIPIYLCRPISELLPYIQEY